MIPFFIACCISFITADWFQAQADHCFETFCAEEVLEGDSIFVRRADLGVFFSEQHGKIKSSYILISHLSDEPSPGEFSSYLEDPKLLAWYAMNWDGTLHPKLHPIPIGLANRKLPHGNLETVVAVQRKNISKKYLLYMNFTIQTFSQERWEVFKRFAREPFCFRTGKKPFEGYLEDMAASKFVLAPRGAGLDTYRLWEALYVGSIPIVKSSSLDLLYEGLPVLIVKDWSEVTEEFLEEKYLEFMERKFSYEKLDASYWRP